MRETPVNQVKYPPRQAESVIATISPVRRALLLLAGVIVLWLISLPRVDLRQMNDLGLVSVLPLTFFVALVILAISFMLALSRETLSEHILLLHVLVLIFILHGTPHILYGTVRYSWAWKHVGIIDYIQRYGSVDPTINALNAYHNWPGFFALAAFYNQVAGVKSSLSYAGWAPVFFNILDLGALLMIFKTMTSNRKLVWLSVWFFFISSWVGQDYFSPQALTYFLYIVALAIILTWFRRYTEPIRFTGIKSLNETWIANIYNAIISRNTQENNQAVKATVLQRIVLMAGLVLILIVIASSHQLTPLMAVSALILLAIFQLLNQRYLPVLMVVITAGWVLFLAVGFLKGNLYWVVTSFGAIFDNFDATLIDLNVASRGQQFIAFIDRSLSASMWVLGSLGFWRRYKAGRWDLPALILAVAPLFMLAANSYGGEMLFRVYLFSLPFVAFFAAGLFLPVPMVARSIKSMLFASSVSLAILCGFLFAYYGKERMYYFTPGEVAAADYIYSTAPKGALIVDATWDWPRQSRNYEFYNYSSLVRLPKEDRARMFNDPDDALAQRMDKASSGSVFVTYVAPMDEQGNYINPTGAIFEGRYPAAYFIVTRSQLAEVQMSGVLPVEWLGKVINVLMASDKFELVYSNQDALVFKRTPVDAK